MMTATSQAALRGLKGVRLPRIVGPKSDRELMAARIAELEAEAAVLKQQLAARDKRHEEQVARLKSQVRQQAQQIRHAGYQPRDPAVPARELAGELVAKAAATSGVPQEAILGRVHDAEVVALRQWCYFEARAAGLSLPQIARAFDRHHSTVFYGIRVEAERRGHHGG